MSIDAATPEDRNVVQKEAENILQYIDLAIEIQRVLECDSKSDTGNIRGDWNRFKITQTVPEQHTGESAKLRNCQKQPYCALHTYCGKC